MASYPKTLGVPGTATGRVRPMTRRDVRAAADLHATHLPHGFFPRLGPPFLREYYRAFVVSPHAVALASGDGARLDGMVVGVVSAREHYRWVLRRRGWRLALAGAAALLVRPWLLAGFVRGRLPRYVRAVRSLRRRPAEPSGELAAQPADRYAVLAHVAVDASARGGGLGAELADRFAEAVAAAGAGSVRATTREGDGGAAGFYERTGWKRLSTTSDWDGHRIVAFQRATAPPSAPSRAT